MQHTTNGIKCNHALIRVSQRQRRLAQDNIIHYDHPRHIKIY